MGLRAARSNQSTTLSTMAASEPSSRRNRFRSFIRRASLVLLTKAKESMRTPLFQRLSQHWMR